jgi:tetratricopeptide (TPR) repeat protein
MDMFRHDDVAHQAEAVPVAHLAENLHENISGANGAQQGQASLASESNEMQMAAPIVADEFVGHGRKEKSNPRPFKSERVGHPEKQNQSHSDDVLEWYHPCAGCRQEKKHGRVATRRLCGKQKAGPPALCANHLDSLWEKITIRNRKIIRLWTRTPFLGEIMRKRNCRTPTLDRQRLALIPSWRQAALCALALALSALPFHAQLKTRMEVGPSGGQVCTSPAGCATPLIGDIPPLAKPVIADDEKCLPWNLSAAQANPSRINALKVPSKAKSEYEKACIASQKKKPEESEQHLRRAIDKFKDYSAAWVMLGVVLDEQHKAQEARDACSHVTTIDAKYFPAYLCLAEFSARNQEWERLLDLANVALDLSPENDGYAHYYRAMAYFYLNNVVDAQQNALQAAQINLNHNYLPLYFLLAQIYAAQGDKVAAAAELRVALKNHNDPAQEDVAKRYLAKLETVGSTTIAQRSVISSESAGTIPLTDTPDEAIASMSDLRTPFDSWIPEDIDHAVPPVASGSACSLPVVLDGAGKRIVELVQNVDRFTATEVLMHQPVDHSGHMGPASTTQFSYLVSYTENPTGPLHVDEFRNGSLSLDPFPNHIATVGTPSLVLIFHPRYVNNFKMECEGLGQWHGQPAWQVRFEQRADRPNLTYSFTIDRETYDVNLRGRAWILAGSYQVARLETDLVQSIPKIRLGLDHQSVEYRPVKSSTKNLQLWLPSSAELYMDFQGQRFYRKHTFTDFRIFSVDMQYQTANPKETSGEQ